MILKKFVPMQLFHYFVIWFNLNSWGEDKIKKISFNNKLCTLTKINQQITINTTTRYNELIRISGGQISKPCTMRLRPGAARLRRGEWPCEYERHRRTYMSYNQNFSRTILRCNGYKIRSNLSIYDIILIFRPTYNNSALGSKNSEILVINHQTFQETGNHSHRYLF